MTARADADRILIEAIRQCLGLRPLYDLSPPPPAIVRFMPRRPTLPAKPKRKYPPSP